MDALYTPEKVFDVNAINSTEMQCIAEKWDNETVETMTKEYQKKGRWSELPAPLLEEVYSFLSHADQTNMSLVCRNWCEAYGSPSVWKTFRFALTESQLSMDPCPVMKFVRRYSNMFQHVEIEFTKTMCEHKIKAWCRYFISFLLILSRNSQVISVSFRDLLYHSAFIDTLTYDNICRAIANFLGSQRHLKRAEFHHCPFISKKFVEILKELTENSRESLTHLLLRNSFRYKFTALEQAQIISMLIGLPSLRILEIDYSLIFENMFARKSDAIQTLKKCRARVLSKLILHYNNNSIKIEDFLGLTSSDWLFLKKLYPELQVELNVTSDLPSRQETEFLIVPNMPITRLNYICDDFHLERHRSSLMEVNVLIDQLLTCKTSDYLISLHLRWFLPIQDLILTFIPFFQACKKLKCFQLFIIYPANGIDLLMEYWLVNRPKSLEKVVIDISNIKNECDYTILMCLVAEYVPRLELVGLKIKVDLKDHSPSRQSRNIM